VDPKSPKKPTNYTNAWTEAKFLMWQHRWNLALGFGLMLISRVCGFVLPTTSRYFIDDVVRQGHKELLPKLALAGGLATLVQAITAFANSQVISVTAQRAITDMRKKVMVHVAHLPVRYFDSTQTGVLISRVMNDAEGIRNLVGTGLIELVGGLFTAVIAMGVLLYLNWKLTTAILLVLAAFGGAMSLAFTKLRPLFRDRGKITAEITGRLAETLGGIRIVKAYTAERREQLVFAKGAHKLFRNIAKSITGVSATGAFATLVIGAVGVLMLIVGGNAVVDQKMSLGEFIQFMFFIGLVAVPVVSIASIGTQITEAFAGLDRIYEIRNMLTEDQEDDKLEDLVNLHGDVAFEDVSFEYNKDVPVLKNISFRAPLGSTTALVGSSGSGKSTLISLVMAFNRPLSGRVTVDGRDLASIPLRDYRQHLGVVMQDNFLFDGTIAENISFSRPGASREEVIAASKVAHCEEFVDGFEKKYDTVVGERGVRLSGGQRQRIAIARAILADPRILILDEATSSLDSESEGMIQDGLRSLRKGRTTFVIAHRLSTIRSANQILVLEHGEIVERGTHHELIEANGRYRQLHDKQYKLELDRFINPGEDFTPELPKPMIPAVRGSGAGAPAL
jgi:ABC-type multidrug transport system fused ATPase/permease subunit